MRRRPLLPLALAAWTVVVWTFRAGTIWTDDGASSTDKLARTALVAVFTALAVATAWCWARRPAALPAVVRGFAVWTAAVWAVRAVQIARADHGAAFIAVHVGLAAVSVVLAVAADRAVRTPERVAAAH